MATKEELQRLRYVLCDNICKLGFPEDFGVILCDTLGTEKQMKRMISYLIQVKPRTMEEVADELVCIKEEFEKYRQRKISEHANAKYTEILNNGLE